MQTYQLDVHVTRGECLESVHRVHAAVVDAQGVLRARARDANHVTAWRSCAKPFQIMPLVQIGGIDELGWGDDELALGCASHGGEPEHVSLAEHMLRVIGLEEGDLACGPHEPLSKRGSRMLRESGSSPTRLHNNCSGKHAAMLARAHLAGWATTGYERSGHPVQEACASSVSHWTGVPDAQLGRGVDGCGVVVFSLPLMNMAASYARLGAAATRGDEVPARVVNAMRSRPFLVGGTDRIDSVLIEETNGAVLAKVGAEGVHTAVAFELGLGVAIKVEDGATRAQYPALLRVLQCIGALPDPLPLRLKEFARTKVRNTRGEVVGEVHVASA